MYQADCASRWRRLPAAMQASITNAIRWNLARQRLSVLACRTPMIGSTASGTPIWRVAPAGAEASASRRGRAS
jgi:hypothetical protein